MRTAEGGQMPYFVYIMASRSGTLYTGVTNNLERRVLEHRSARPGSFTARYRIVHLVHVEVTDYVHQALRREKQIKSWSRAKRVALIEANNPGWEDLLPTTQPPSK